MRRMIHTPAGGGAAPWGGGAGDRNLVIMGDDIGMWNIGAYHRGMMAGRTPNLDKLAKEGMLFTDYYAEASCTAGRANFITGQLPIRTGMTTVGQAGAPIGLPAEAVTIATVLKSMGYATGQFGKNHLGDMNEFLPTVHGFDEFFGYLYHLDAMEDPAHPNYPQELRDAGRPRNMVHSWATNVTIRPRSALGQDRQAEDRGRRHALSQADGDGGRRDPRPRAQVHRQGQGRRQAVLPLAQPDPHAHRHPPLPEVPGDAQLEEWLVDSGSRHGPTRRHRRLVMKKLKDMGVDDNTIVVFTTDNGTEIFTWPDGGQTPFAQCKGTIMEGGFRAPA